MRPIVEAQTILEAVTPWHAKPYVDQLALKESDMRKTVIKCIRRTRKEYANKVKRQKREKNYTKCLTLPEWLNSKGHLYMSTMDGGLYRTHV